ncbi:hypothetical protein QUF74_08945 [Candidatus Halobeggiatoa sp. HSG11]|nr:hypothetical protein [Candidatus Halobeggiatoa sp. HSG11]
MKYHRIFILIAVYSAVLLTVEWQTSQIFIRQFLTDIGQYEIAGYAVNTTLSVFLLWAIALLFVISLSCVDKKSTEYWFFISQIIMFTYLGCDERFLIHENVGRLLGRNDAYLLLGLGLLEVGLLVWLGNLKQKTKLARQFLYTAAILFATMVLIDAKFPKDMVLRLSLEELTKLWADICLFLFAWEIMQQQIRIKKSAIE